MSESQSIDARRRRPRFRFEKLDVFQGARAFLTRNYRLTRAFPQSEQFGLTSQMRRAALSVLSNIAEGSGRNSDKDFAHFLEQAYGSLMEAAGQAFAALDERHITDEVLDEYLAEAQRLSAQIAALNRSLNIPTSKVQLPESR